MGDLTQDVRDAAGALAALVPHAVSFGQPVVDSIKTACDAVEPTLAKDEVIIAVVGDASAKRVLLRNVLGADAIVGPKARKERTIFDYVKRLARIRKETPEKVEDKVKPLTPDMLRDNSLRDILTAIYYLRQNADRIHGPMETSIYSDGKDYPVIFRPAEAQTCVIDGRRLNTSGFEIVDAPGGRKWQGGVKVWLTQDERRIPCRIEIRQSFAMLQLDLSSIEACAFMSASK